MFNTFSLDSNAKNFRPVKKGERIVIKIRDSQKSQKTRLTVCIYDKSQDLMRDIFSNNLAYLSDSKEYILLTNYETTGFEENNIPPELSEIEFDFSVLEEKK